MTGVNDRPDAVDDSIRTDEDTVATLSAPGLLRNDSDLDGDVLTVDQVDGAGGNVGRTFRTARGATLRVNADGSLSYDPTGQFDALRPGEQATDSFTYRVSDGNGANDTATVSITIDGVNDAPSAAADSYDAVGNTTLVVSDPVPTGEAAKQLTGSVQDNDSDPDNSRAELSIRSEKSARDWAASRRSRATAASPTCRRPARPGPTTRSTTRSPTAARRREGP